MSLNDNMTLSDMLCDIYDDKAPASWFVRIRQESTNIELYGPNKLGVSIPIAKIDEVIAELKTNYQDPKKTYDFRDLIFKLPGEIVPHIIQYLQEIVKDKARYPKSLVKRTFG